MKNLLITLLSDQTIPNVQFIKEKRNNDTQFLFVSTPKMENKGVQKWIMNVCNIPQEKAETKIVEEFSLADIENKLSEIIYDNYAQIFVNITGGTKIMSMGVADFFKAKNADIYYIDGKECWHIFPSERSRKAPLVDNISLKEYVESYGFAIREGSLSGINYEYTQDFLQHFINFGDCEWRIINHLREKRGKSAQINEINGMQDFLCNINFPLTDQKFLTVNKNEVKYLTGDWFEEYIYCRLKQELSIANENIKTGITLTKSGITNEFDVVFLWKGTLYTIECKTSIINKAVIGMNILNETIYKTTALQKNLGLFTKSFIFTLSSKDGKEVKSNHIDRAKVFGVQVYCKEDITNSQNISKLLISNLVC